MMQSVMGYEFFTLDVFTTERFGGNPLAVVTQADQLSDAQMAQIAREFNLSETVFVMTPKLSVNTAKIRIFTPAHELPFAGHPTVGTAILLAEMGADMSKPLKTIIRLEEKIGLVEVAVSRNDGSAAYSELSAAQMPVAKTGVPGNDIIGKALSISGNDIGFGLHKPTIYDGGNTSLYVPVSSRQALAIISADMGAWGALGDAGKFGVYIYCRGPAESNQFHARFLGPEVGVVEDPATGSAAVGFAGVLNEALVLEDGKHSWLIHQGEDMGRPSRIDLSADVENGEVVGVRVGGNAVRVSRGVISV